MRLASSISISGVRSSTLPISCRYRSSDWLSRLVYCLVIRTKTPQRCKNSTKEKTIWKPLLRRRIRQHFHQFVATFYATKLGGGEKTQSCNCGKCVEVGVSDHRQARLQRHGGHDRGAMASH